MRENTFRTRFRRQLAAEFLPPLRLRKTQKLIILCDAMPSIPRKQPLAEFLVAQVFRVIYPRYRGAWEGGATLRRSRPTRSSSTSSTICQRKLKKSHLVGVSCYLRIKSSSSEKASGGAAAILASLDHE
jgi:hypothetical protein